MARCLAAHLAGKSQAVEGQFRQEVPSVLLERPRSAPAAESSELRALLSLLMDESSRSSLFASSLPLSLADPERHTFI